jgi:hypothetical protein
MKMIANIDPLKSLCTSLVSLAAGSTSAYAQIHLFHLSLSTVNTGFQHAAWTVAILAGIVAVINGVRKWKIPVAKLEKDEE